jgi:metal-responsive CopG/Arc/MetJ family transcriptional regulator
MVIARKQTLVQLSDDLIAALDARAAREGKSRSALIREAVQQHLHDEVEAEIDRQIVEGYTRLPQTEEEMEWGDRMAADVLQWLDEEDGGWDEEDQSQ